MVTETAVSMAMETAGMRPSKAARRLAALCPLCFGTSVTLLSSIVSGRLGLGVLGFLAKRHYDPILVDHLLVQGSV